MKKISLITAIVLMVSSALFAFDGYVDITNNTGYSIYYIFVSHTSDDSWGVDMLGEDNILPDGGFYRVTVSDQPSSIFDIMLEDEDGDTYTFYGVDLESEDIVVTLDDLDAAGVGETTVNGPGGSFNGYVDVTNHTGFTGMYLYIRQGAKSSWGADLLGEDTLPDGDYFTVNVRNYPSSVFDIRLEDEDGDTYTFKGVDIEAEDVSITLGDLD